MLKRFLRWFRSASPNNVITRNKRDFARLADKFAAARAITDRDLLCELAKRTEESDRQMEAERLRRTHQRVGEPFTVLHEGKDVTVQSVSPPAVILDFMKRDDLRASAKYVLNPPMVPCRDHPGYTIQFESQSTLLLHARELAKAYLATTADVDAENRGMR